jgi:hypothetical protein
MRQIAVVLALILAACGSDSTGPSTGTLFVSFDAGSCALLGMPKCSWTAPPKAPTSGPPASSARWTTGAGSHAVGAREVGGTGLTWPAQTVTVPKDGSYSAVFTC